MPLVLAPGMGLGAVLRAIKEHQIAKGTYIYDKDSNLSSIIHSDNSVDEKSEVKEL